MVAELRHVAPDDLAERPCVGESHGTEVHERHGGGLGGLLLDHRVDELLEVLQEGVRQHGHRELRDRPGGGHLDPQVEARSVAVRAELAGVAVPGDDLAVRHVAQLAGLGLGDVSDLVGLRGERLGECLQVVGDLLDVAGDVSHAHAGQPTLGVDGEPEGDVRALDQDPVALGQLGHSGPSLVWYCLDRDMPFHLLAKEQP